MSNTRGSEAAARRGAPAGDGADEVPVVKLFPCDRAGFEARADDDAASA
jgi:hypothetical protein